MTLLHSSAFKTLDKTFATANFTTKSIHEMTKWPPAIAWPACGLADVCSLIFMTLACARRK